MEQLRGEMAKMMEWVLEQNRNAPRPVMHKVLELVSAKLEEKSLEVDRLKDLDPRKQEERHRLINLKELAVRPREKEVRITVIDLEGLERLRIQLRETIGPRHDIMLKLRRRVLGLDSGRALATGRTARPYSIEIVPTM